MNYNLLNEARIALGWSMQQLSDESKIPLQTVKNILSGKTQEFLRIPESTEAYGISYQDFYDYIQEVIARFNPIFLVFFFITAADKLVQP